jgi:hypothetical protein
MSKGSVLQENPRSIKQCWPRNRLKIQNASRVWWVMAVIPAPGRLKQEGLGHKVSLGKVRETLSQNQNMT